MATYAVIMTGSVDNRNDLYTGQKRLASPRPYRLGTTPFGENASEGKVGGLATAADATVPGYALRPGVVLADGATASRVRVQIGGFTTFYVLFKLSAITAGTVTLNCKPMLADATSDESTGTQRTIGAPTALTFTTSTAQEMSYTCKGEEFVDITAALVGGGADTATIAYVEVYGT